MIAALFVETNGVYFNLPNVDPWDISRNAMLYDGCDAVITHPPCQRWGMLAHLVQSKSNGRLRVGDDGGTFAKALVETEKNGGVLEHPENSYAFAAYGLDRPKVGKWTPSRLGFVTTVAQSAYGHRATKRTWLYVCGLDESELPCLDWSCPRGTHEIGGESRLKGKRPSLPKSERSRTPVAFRDLLISIAEKVNQSRSKT